MIYGSVCSGIEAATVAWRPLGWKAAFFAEVAKFPSAVLAHHYPGVPNHGDFTTIQPGDYEPIDLLVGGTPCQDFSVAGLRAGMDGKRGQLTVEFARLAGRLRPRWLVWENVPGVLSIDGGRAFGTFLGMLGECGYGLAYRVLDAQHFGVPQRRRRVFVVGHLGDWRRAAAVLFERHSLSGDSAPRREAGQSAPTIPSRSTGGGGLGTDFDCDGGLVASNGLDVSFVRGAKHGNEQGFDGASASVRMVPVASTGDIAHCLNAGGMGRQDFETETLVAHALRAEGFDASEDGMGRGTPLVMTLAIRGRDGGAQLEVRDDGIAHTVLTPSGGRAGIGVGAVAFDCKASGRNGFGVGSVAPTLRAMGHADSHQNAGGQVAVAVRTAQTSSNGHGVAVESAHTLDGANAQAVSRGMAVRRLTPRECERLQGFPDDYTLIPLPLRGRQTRVRYSSDGSRYKALGNSMARPVMQWIGERIDAAEGVLRAD